MRWTSFKTILSIPRGPSDVLTASLIAITPLIEYWLKRRDAAKRRTFGGDHVG